MFNKAFPDLLFCYLDDAGKCLHFVGYFGAEHNLVWGNSSVAEKSGARMGFGSPPAPCGAGQI